MFFIVSSQSLNKEIKDVTRYNIYKHLFLIDHNTTANFLMLQIFGEQATFVFHNMGE